MVLHPFFVMIIVASIWKILPA